MTKTVAKYILLLFFLTFLNCVDTPKNPTDHSIDKDPPIKSRIERITYRKNKIDSLNKAWEWKKYKANLWMNCNGELGIKTAEANEEEIDIVRYITQLCCEGNSLQSVIDTTSFQFLGSSFYKDKNHIYTHFEMSDGGNFWVVEEADVATFKIIGDCYAKDKNHIFGERAMVMDSVDYKTFKTEKGSGCFAKDKNGFYFWDKKIDLATINDSLTQKKIMELKKL